MGKDKEVGAIPHGGGEGEEQMQEEEDEDIPEGVIAGVNKEGEFVVHVREESDEPDTDLPHVPGVSVSAGSRRSSQSSQPSQRSQTRPPRRAKKPGFFRRLCCCVKAPPSRTGSSSVFPDANIVDVDSKGLGGGFVLPPLSPEDAARGRKTLVLDLDETLVHSSFKYVEGADFIVPVTIEGTVHSVYVLKRPFVEEFLVEVSKHYETIVFTASLGLYADPVIDLLDPHGVVSARLFREHCVPHQGLFVKDLSRLGRDLRHTLIIDNAPQSFLFQPDNGITCVSWFDDREDTQLRDFVPLLEHLAQKDDVVVELQRIIRLNEEHEAQEARERSAS